MAIQSELNIPVKYIGVGEHIDDLQKFDADTFVNALFPDRDRRLIYIFANTTHILQQEETPMADKMTLEKFEEACEDCG